jgi:hypothetical protein
MTNLVNETVTVITRKGAVKVEGTVIKHEGTVIWLTASNGDQFKFFTDWDYIEVKSAIEKNEEKLQSLLDENGFQYSGISDGSGVNYIVEGYTYNVSCYLNEDGSFDMETTHNERYARIDADVFNPYADVAEAWANRATRKTLKGALNYIIKWTSK